MDERRALAPGGDLAGALRRLVELTGPRDVLVRAAEGARDLVGAASVVASAAAPGQTWERATHVLVQGDEALEQVPRVATSATHAVYRRLCVERRVLRIERASGPEAVFAGLSVDGRAREVVGVPLMRRGVPCGCLVLVDVDDAALLRAGEQALAVLADATVAALDNAVRFAAAKRDQERLFLFAEATDEAVWDCALDTEEVWWGGGIHDMLGGGGASLPPTLDGKLGIVHPDDRDRVRASLLAAARGSAPVWREEYRLGRRDGRWMFVEDRGYFLRGADGRADRIVGALRDVTALRGSLERLHTVVDNATSALFLMDARQHCTYMNAPAERMTGFTLAEVQGRPLHEFVHHTHPDGRPYPLEECPIDRALPTRARERGEEIFVHADGTFYPVSFTASPIIEAGVPVGTVIEVKDISEERRRAEEKDLLVDVSSLLSASLHAPDTMPRLAAQVAARVADGCVVEAVDDGALVILGAAFREAGRADALGRRRAQSPVALSSEHAAARVARTGRRLALSAEDGDVALEPEARRPGEALLSLPLYAHGALLGALTLTTARRRGFDERDVEVALDLAQRTALALEQARLYRQAQEAIRARDDFLSIASHELKTPLTALQLQLSVVRGRIASVAADEAAQGWLGSRLELIDRQSLRLGRLIDQLLDLSRIVGRRLRLELEDADLAAVAREVVASAVEQGEAARAGCEVRLRADEPVVGRWDRLRLEQVVTNLLSNALKYGGGRPVDVVVERRGDRARLVVVDRGVGVAPEDSERIFGRFERAVSSRHYGGLGLGLYIVRQIVAALGGEVMVESKKGDGATFVVELPLAQPASPP